MGSVHVCNSSQNHTIGVKGFTHSRIDSMPMGLPHKTKDYHGKEKHPIGMICKTHSEASLPMGRGIPAHGILMGSRKGDCGFRFGCWLRLRLSSGSCRQL